ncbi:MAG: BACON domain-containing protein [Alistipes sp.]|nr:BACON domain-containing protein [Alistipes sp.]
MNKRDIKIVLTFVLAAVLLGSCVKEDIGYTDGVPDGDEIEFTFSYTSPGMDAPGTRTVISADDTKIEAVDVLAYKVDPVTGEEIFAYHRRHISVTYAGNGEGTFTVRLARSEGSEKYSFDLLANVTENDRNTYLGNISIGDDIVTVRSNITRGNAQVSVTTLGPLPHWAYIPPMEVDRDAVIGQVKFICSVARVDIGLNWPEDDKPAGGLPNFKFTTLAWSGYPAGGYLMPHPDNYDIATRMVTAPTLWSAMNTSAPTLRTGITDDFFLRGCYIFEPDVNRIGSAGRVFCLIVGGPLYDSDGSEIGVRFFPLRLKDPNDPTKKLDYLKGHRYRINIIGINGPGYTTAALAAAAEDNFEITYELTVHEQGDINHVVYSSTNYLGISSISETFDAAGGSGELKVRTDVSEGWSVTFQDENGAQPSWITTSGPLSGAADATGSIAYTVAPNSGDYSPRTAYARFKAGSLEISTRVHQNGEWFIKSDYNPALNIKGDGDKFTVSIWGDIPPEVLVRAYSPEFEEYTTRLFISGEIPELPVSPPVSMETLRYTGGFNLAESAALEDELRIIANTMVTNIIRKVQFQYSTDGGTSWVPFEEGPQGKGHFFLPEDGDEKGHTGRMVALYNMVEALKWPQAMGIDPMYGEAFFYSTYQPDAYTGNDGSDLARYWRANYWYTPTHPTGCADYFEEDYPEFERGGWRLPTMFEMDQISIYNLHIGDVPFTEFYWSSSEDTGGMAYRGNSFKIKLIGADAGLPADPSSYEYIDKLFEPLSVRCVYGEPVANPPQ